MPGKPFTLAPVSGVAKIFAWGNALPGAKITFYETEQNDSKLNTVPVPVLRYEKSFDDKLLLTNEHQSFLTTDEKGEFGPIAWPVGKLITARCEVKNFQTIQTATFIVPVGGIHHKNPLKNITFQVPSEWTCWFFSKAMGSSLNKNGKGQGIVVTVTDADVTMADMPQGFPDVSLSFQGHPIVERIKPFYFGIFGMGPLSHYTNPFARSLTKTTIDGGAFVNLNNVNLKDMRIRISAHHPQVGFNSALVFPFENILINVAPGFGAISATTPSQQHVQLPHGKQPPEEKIPGIAGKSLLVGISIGLFVRTQSNSNLFAICASMLGVYAGWKFFKHRAMEERAKKDLMKKALANFSIFQPEKLPNISLNEERSTRLVRRL